MTRGSLLKDLVSCRRHGALCQVKITITSSDGSPLNAKTKARHKQLNLYVLIWIVMGQILQNFTLFSIRFVKLNRISKCLRSKKGHLKYKAVFDWFHSSPRRLNY